MEGNAGAEHLKGGKCLHGLDESFSNVAAVMGVIFD